MGRWRSNPLSRVFAPLVALLTPFDEPISCDFYRQMGRVRACAVLLLAVLNVLGTAFLALIDVLTSYDLARQVVIVTLSLCDVVIGFWMARYELSVRTLRRATLVGAAIEVVILMISMHGLGSVNSYMLSASILLVVLYRFGFDRRLSATVLGFTLVSHWATVLAEVFGILTVQPLGQGQVDLIYQSRVGHIGAMWLITGIYVLGYLVAHWLVLRLRHREAAVRILREAVRGGHPERVGELTGAVLGGRYEVGELIGQGGAGVVYAGRHHRTLRPVAIKVLHRHLLERSRALARFRREAEITGQLQSEHVVQILDVDEHDGHPYLVFELLRGIDLKARVRRDGRIDPSEVLAIARGVARGLDTAHREGVVHRDLNPANVFLCAHDTGPLVKILDFGVAKPLADEAAITVADALLGTPAFMAPEQVSGKHGSIGPHTDVYALGATLYFALTGVLPFPSAEPSVVLGALSNYRPTPATQIVPTLPPAVDDVLTVAMATSGVERFESARQLVDALTSAVTGEPLPSWVTLRALELGARVPTWSPPESRANSERIASVTMTCSVS